MNAGDVTRAVDAVDFGRPTAAKRGRDPRWPYVPVIDHGRHTEQLRGLAYATRAEAVARAVETIARRRAELARKLAEPQYRALRESHGLPRELEAS